MLITTEEVEMSDDKIHYIPGLLDLQFLESPLAKVMGHPDLTALKQPANCGLNPNQLQVKKTGSLRM
jgi:hypothetical protein